LTLVIANRGIRTFGYGFVSVLLGIYLSLLGASDGQVILALGVSLASGAGLNILVGRYGDRYGRRRAMVLFGLTMTASGLVLGLAPSFGLALVALLLGSVSPTGTEVGPFLSLEQSVVAEAVEPARRARAFALYNLLGAFAGAAGALASGLPTFLLGAAPMTADPLRPMFILYAVLGVVAAGLGRALPRKVEVAEDRASTPLTAESRVRVARIAGLFAVDSFAGGFIIQSFVAFWFYVTFPESREILGPIFFASGVLTALSFLAAARLSERIGLLETMVFTHLPSNVLLILVPLAPTFPLALGLYLGRNALSQMDVPTRQAYLAGIVAREERTTANATTNATRSLAHAGGPFAAGALVPLLGLAFPFFAGGGLKILYDLTLYAIFRKVRPDT
ncbi:MAG: MFS transporter, partial [Thermoplasmata archaeon]|nr:MFS transporter [Thermoplasmata archaeon]